ncbi:MmgE/PrpD family protein [Phytohabitans suffuscus]
MSYTTEVADYVAGARFAALPDSAVRAAQRVTLDLLGVLVAASRSRPGVAMNAYVRGIGAQPRASVLGTGIRTATSYAALANGTMAAELELDDVHEKGTHPSSVYVPALLAVAEDVDAGGRDWVTALVTAYDVGCRLSWAMGMREVYGRGFHPTAICGSFGAVAGVASLLRLDAPGVVNAFGLTGNQAAGLLTWETQAEHFTKSFQTGMAARNAVTAGELAACGYIGPPDTFDGRYNVFDAFSTSRDFDELTQTLGSRHEIEHTGFKFYTCCRAIHAALDILFDLVAEHRFTAADVADIRVRLTAGIAPLVDGNPLTTHNLQYILAVALVDGEVTQAQTAPDRRADPALGELAGRITLVHDPSLGTARKIVGPTQMTVRLRDGRIFEDGRDDPRGGTAHPATDQEIERKFRRLARQALAAERAEQIIAEVRRLPELPSLRGVVALATDHS